MVLTDPPYGVTAQNWDIEFDIQKLWSELNRVTKKDGAILVFAAQPFTTKLISSNLKNFKYCWYWIKNQGTNFYHAKRMPIRKLEEVCVFNSKVYYPQVTHDNTPTNSAKGKSKGNIYFGENIRNESGGKTTRYPTNILEFSCVNNYQRVHPSQKPVDLLKYLISTYTKEGETVLDCFAGSGSTGVAAKELNREFIGIEKELEIFNTMIERLK